jgi:hypothetical protein
MNTNKSSVEVLGTVNTVDFERVMNQFSSSFTESFLKVVESQFGMGIQSKVVEEVKPKVVKPKVKSKPSPIGTVLNRGFEKLKNPILKTELERCKSVDYDTSKFITIRELGIKSIYELDKRSKGFWNDYFTKGKVYLRKGVNTPKISQKILFDRVIVDLLKGGRTEPKSSVSTLPQ